MLVFFNQLSDCIASIESYESNVRWIINCPRINIYQNQSGNRLIKKYIIEIWPKGNNTISLGRGRNSSTIGQNNKVPGLDNVPAELKKEGRKLLI